MKPKSKYNLRKPEAEWSGLTLDEIRYARALTRARIEISREMFATRASALYQGKDLTTGQSTLLGKMLGALNWLDYGLIAFRILSKFKRKK